MSLRPTGTAPRETPFLFEQREAAVPDISEDEVLLRVRACGFCGHDMVLARGAADGLLDYIRHPAGAVRAVMVQ